MSGAWKNQGGSVDNRVFSVNNAQIRELISDDILTTNVICTDISANSGIKTIKLTNPLLFSNSDLTLDSTDAIKLEPLGVGGLSLNLRDSSGSFNITSQGLTNVLNIKYEDSTTSGTFLLTDGGTPIAADVTTFSANNNVVFKIRLQTGQVRFENLLGAGGGSGTGNFTGAAPSGGLATLGNRSQEWKSLYLGNYQNNNEYNSLPGWSLARGSIFFSDLTPSTRWWGGDGNPANGYLRLSGFFEPQSNKPQGKKCGILLLDPTDLSRDENNQTENVGVFCRYNNDSPTGSRTAVELMGTHFVGSHKEGSMIMYSPFSTRIATDIFNKNIYLEVNENGIDISGNMNMSKAISTFSNIFCSDISNNNLIHTNLLRSKDISSNNIYVTDLSSTNINVNDLSANNLIKTEDLSSNTLIKSKKIINQDDINTSWLYSNNANILDVSSNTIIVTDLSANNLIKTKDLSSNNLFAYNSIISEQDISCNGVVKLNEIKFNNQPNARLFTSDNDTIKSSKNIEISGNLIISQQYDTNWGGTVADVASVGGRPIPSHQYIKFNSEQSLLSIKVVPHVAAAGSVKQQDEHLVLPPTHIKNTLILGKYVEDAEIDMSADSNTGTVDSTGLYVHAKQGIKILRYNSTDTTQKGDYSSIRSEEDGKGVYMVLKANEVAVDPTNGGFIKFEDPILCASIHLDDASGNVRINKSIVVTRPLDIDMSANNVVFSNDISCNNIGHFKDISANILKVSEILRENTINSVAIEFAPSARPADIDMSANRVVFNNDISCNNIGHFKDISANILKVSEILRENTTNSVAIEFAPSARPADIDISARRVVFSNDISCNNIGYFKDISANILTVSEIQRIDGLGRQVKNGSFDYWTTDPLATTAVGFLGEIKIVALDSGSAVTTNPAATDTFKTYICVFSDAGPPAAYVWQLLT